MRDLQEALKEIGMLKSEGNALTIKDYIKGIIKHHYETSKARKPFENEYLTILPITNEMGGYITIPLIVNINGDEKTFNYIGQAILNADFSLSIVRDEIPGFPFN